jgi:hypothetical protein
MLRSQQWHYHLMPILCRPMQRCRSIFILRIDVYLMAQQQPYHRLTPARCGPKPPHIEPSLHFLSFALTLGDEMGLRRHCCPMFNMARTKNEKFRSLPFPGPSRDFLVASPHRWWWRRPLGGRAALTFPISLEERGLEVVDRTFEWSS